MPFPLLSLAVLGALLAAAAWWDLRWRRIPNLLAVSVAATGLLSQLYVGGVASAGWALLAALALATALWLPWSRGLVGGGDLKLAAATASWVGASGLAAYVLSAALAGGLLSLACWALSEGPARAEMRANLIRVRVSGQLSPVAPESPGRVSVPYAVAIMVGAAVSLFYGG
ncbi:MAG: A24 family peptidase [Myxococcales bacterium]|jgi:prepilin peptidase CpaA